MKNNTMITKRYSRILALNIGITLTSTMAFAAQGPATFFGTSINNMLSSPLPTVVPTGFAPVTGMSARVDDVVNNKTGKRKVTVHQVEDKAIASWDTFDIGKNSWVYFDQQGNADWQALNRIYDQNPSQIFGKLTADGQVYLINQNGILFGGSAAVNVHSLVASSLDLDNDAFANLTKTSAATFDGSENYDPEKQPDWQPGKGFVYNQGFISAELVSEKNGKAQVIRDGSVFLVAPEVGNSGTIVAPYGQIGLAAGGGVTLAPEPDSTYQNEKYVSAIDTPGQAVNEEGGRLVADNGRVGMYGRIVNQEGMVRSVTSVWHRGAIELRATEKVVTGKNSETLAPVSTSAEKTGDDFSHRPGEIYIGGIGRGGGMATGTVEHNGTIAAASGDVKIHATDRAYFGAGSVIDVSGAWSVRDGEDQWHTQELNTAQLKDDHRQKNENSLLYHSEVTVNELFGSTIGDFDETYEADQLTSLQKASRGGSIRVEAPEGDIIVRSGASFDISGGGHYHGESTGIGTKLLFGNRIYDLDEAPSYLPYEAFADSYEKKHERYDITESYSGLYAGGAVPLYDRIPAHVEGHDAGNLTLISRSLVFAGSLAAQATVGPYQIYDPDQFNDGIIEIDGKQFTERLRRPRSGALQVGGVATDGDYADQSNVLGELIIDDAGPELPADFSADSPRDVDSPSHLPAATVNAAGLGALTVKANRQIVVDDDADIRLAAGGELNFESRRIEHRGTIDIPAGSVTMALQHNYTNVPANPGYAEVSERLILAAASRISTGGERIDQIASLAAGKPVATGVQTDGGTISLRDLTRNTIPSFEDGLIEGLGQGDGIILAKGALLDVSGGYEITAAGGVRGGDAGALLISGSSVILEGEVRGRSLAGAEGGSIAIFANNIRVEKKAPELYANFDVDAPLPLLDFGYDGDAGYPREQHLRQFSKGLVLADNRFARTGFSRISLNSIYDFVIADGVQLTVSTTRETSPVAAKTAAAAARQVDVPDTEAGSTAFTITAGGNLDGVVDFDSDYSEYADDKDYASLMLPADSSIALPVGGAVALAAPQVTIGGSIEAPAGEITITATNGDLHVGGNADISAAGYISPVGRQVIENLAPVHELWDAGSITLKNTTSGGRLEIEKGAAVDVSGTEETVIYYANLGTTAEPVTGAGRAGSITLSSRGEMIVAQDTLRGRAHFPGMVNGSLTIERNDGTAGYVVEEQLLDIFSDNDFYEWRLASSNSLVFEQNLRFAHDGRLILDTPLLASGNDAVVKIAADWLQLDNTYLPTSAAPAAGNGRFALAGDTIDITGAVAFTGAAAISLAAASDLKLTDHLYTVSGAAGSQYYAGALRSAADLRLTADRIYPATYSDFTIATDRSITILPGSPASGSLLYSAAGNLTLSANRIDHQGYLAAPLGTITLTGTGENSRVMLSPGSVTSVAGQSGMVAFGDLNDTGEFWTYQRKENAGTALSEAVASAPGKKLTLAADEVIVREEAEIDLAGGGAIFAYRFQPGLEGTVDPFVKEGQYLVVPGLELPGEVVRLAGGNGLAAGTYTLLPLDAAHAENVQYAFLPGACVLIDQGSFTGNMPARTMEGFAVVSGYTGVRGQALDTRLARGFALRPATDVFSEGLYATKELTGGDGGSFELVGRQTTVTAILEGDMRAMALDGYLGGTFTAVARSVEIGPESFGLDDVFGIDDEIPADLQGKLNIKDTTFSGNGFSSIIVGDTAITRSIVLRRDSSISAENIAFNAGSGYLQEEEKAAEIIVESGARIHATQPASGGSGYSEVVFTTDAAFHYDPAQEQAPVNTILPGSISLAEGSLVHAADNITLDTDNIDLQDAGTLRVDHSTLTLKSSRIVFSAAGRPQGENGLFLKGSQWKKFAGIEEIHLNSATDILFAGDFSLTGRDQLVFDAQRIGGYEQDDYAAVRIVAPHITLTNSKPAYDDAESREWLPGVVNLAVSDSGAKNFLTLQGNEGITLGPGDMRVDGFREVNLRTGGDVALTGQAYQGKDERDNDIYDPSALRAQADMTISADRLRLDPMDNGVYKAADYLLSAAETVRIMPAAGGGQTASTVNPGGRLRVEGRTIDQQGLIDTLSATVILSGEEVKVGGTVRSAGSDSTAAGSVTIRAANSFTLEEEGVLDVSAGSQGDAGILDIIAPHAGGLSLDGALLGSARNRGTAGSLTMDVRDLSGTNGSTGFDTLAGMLAAGGFFQSIDVRSREGNITLGAGKTLTAEQFKMTADGNDSNGDNPTGNIDIYGTVNAAGEEGGAIELYAAGDLTLHGGARLRATAAAAGASGGDVFLSAAPRSDAQSPRGYIRMHDNAVVDVSGGENGEGGGVAFRAQRNAAGNDVKMNLAGTVIGAAGITAEGVRLYSYSQLTTTEQNTMKGHAAGYAGKVKAFSSGNTGVKGVFDDLATENVDPGAFHHRAGIEVRSSGNLTVKNGWNLTNWLGAGAEPVNLTLRAAGNLNINENIYDKPTASTKRVGLLMRGNLEEDVSRPSADLNLIAGARTDSADFMAVAQTLAGSDTSGRLAIADNRKVYTETGNIRFASASDTVIGRSAVVNPSYDPSPWKEGNLASTLASFRGNVQGSVGRDLIAKGAIQTATGDIAIRTGRDAKLYDPQDPNRKLTGAIRTTGVPDSYEVDYVNIASAGMLQFYDYGQGGDIVVTSGGDIMGGVTTLGKNWDAWWRGEARWGAAFNQTDGGTLGIATMAGGDVRVTAAGDIDTQMGTFGLGDLAVRSGSDLNGRFLAAGGRADLYAQGSFGSARANQQVELMDGKLFLMAEGDIFLGTVLNPSYARSKLGVTLDEPQLLMGYTSGSSVSLRAVHGDVAISGHSDYETANGGAKSLITILPASLDIAAGRDIILSMDKLTLSPSADGNLSLRAGHDILGTSFTNAGYPQPAHIRMLQSDPEEWYGLQTTDLGTDAPLLPLHTGDAAPVSIAAGGNIENIRIESPKRAEVTAGNDILDLELRAQNIGDSDISLVRAGGDIVMGSYERPSGTKAYSGFRFAGPGEAVVQAGGAISLGTTEGIRSVANGPEAGITAWDEGVHPSLSFEGADLYVLSGMAEAIEPAEVRDFFDAIRQANKEISLLMQAAAAARENNDLQLAAAKDAEALEVEERARQELILPLFGTAYPELDDSAGISMTQSKIATLYGGDINIFSSGDLDVGGSLMKKYISQEEEQNGSSGIKTEFGGDINIFSVGDVNVNESRAMTWMGGDITIWTESDINAGRGSTTAVNASGAAVPRINEQAVAELFKKPSVGGSGIRAVTYDPDGPNGPRQIPAAGDIYLFAKGTIDAGEAGIFGSSIYLAASKVVNAQNITFSQSGVGVPVQSEAPVNIGAISGAGAMLAATLATPSAAGLGEAQQKAMQDMSDLNETLVPKVLKVEVIDLQENL